MSCNRAYEYFMNHMDSSLTIMEAEWLDIHLAKCDKCREDFIAYEAILGALSEEEEIEAPADLEIKIMEQIEILPTLKDVRDKRKALMLTVLSTVFTGIIGLMAFASGHLDSVGEIFANSRLMTYTEFLGTAADYTLVFIGEIGVFLGELAIAASVLFDGFRYIMLFAIAGLIFVQLVLRQEDKLTNGTR
ncbi:MAG: hypothetical protein FWE24_04800 [Defluviitaleaceae bacterium]|nr:hypothetical protein [Defluviitaleaceae bacterium]